MPRHLCGRALVPVLIVATVGAAAWAATPFDAGLRARPDRPPESDGTIVMRWSYPDDAPPSLVDWHRRHAAGLAAVERAWSRLLRRLAGQIPTRFEAPCRHLAERLDALDEATLLPAPDRLLDLYLKRMLWHLGQASGRCRPDQIWNVVHHLEEARHALGEVRWVLERHGLEGGRWREEE